MVTEQTTLPLLAQLLLFSLLLLLSLADLKYRAAPAVEIFFIGCILIAFTTQSLLHLGAVAFSVAYGVLWLPSSFALPLLLWPQAWPTLLIGYGVRKELMGKGDLFAIGGISALYSLDVVIIALIGTALWSRWWCRRYVRQYPASLGVKDPIDITLVPLLPGMVMGTMVGVAFHLLLKSYLPLSI
jgi:hypothetical protein